MSKKLFVIPFLFSLLLVLHSNSFAYPTVYYEKAIQGLLREFYDAQNIYQETVGDGNFGGPQDLIDAGLLHRSWRLLYLRGYRFGVTYTPRVRPISLAEFYVVAAPVNYGKTGRNSYRVDNLGVMRRADRNGQFATATDPIFANFPYVPLKIRSDSRMINTMRLIHSAQATYQATAGNGNYGTFSQLVQAGLIVSKFQSGKYGGYNFTITKTDFTSNAPAAFRVTATPDHYDGTGIRSFFIDETGVLRGADKNGAPAVVTDPEIESVCSPIDDCAIASLRTLHGAQMTYASAIGNGNYASLAQLYAANLINSNLADGSAGGYNFTCQTIAATISTPAYFKLWATPINYGATGIRSFYIGTDGVLRGADKMGGLADEDDPPIK